MRYKAFISYSHEADAALASAVQSALHKFAKPWYRVRALHLFRDQTSLAANPALAASLQRAILDSDFFIVIASPQAAQSAWVSRELAVWLKERSPLGILIVLAGGDIVWSRGGGDFDCERTNSLPPVLRGQFLEEPLYVDLRWTRDSPRADLSLKNGRFREAILNIAAPLHGKSKEELDGEDVRQFRRTRWIAAGAAIVMLIALAMVGWQTVVSAGRKKALLSADSKTLQQEKLANSRKLAAEAARCAESDPELSLRLAAEASARAHTGEAEDSLRRALVKSRLRGVIGDQENRIQMAEFSPDGKLLVTSDSHSVVRVWKAPDWSQQAQLPTDVGDVLWISFSRDGQYLVTTSRDRNPKMWSTVTWKPVREFVGHDGAVHCAEFSPDGRHLATAGADHTVRLWDVSTSASVSVLTGHTDAVLGVVFSPDSQRLISVADSNSDEHPTRLWDVAAHKLIAFLEGTIADFDKPVFTHCSIFSRDSKLAATVRNQSVWIWNANTGKLADHQEFKDRGRIWGASFSPMDNSLAIGDYDGLGRVWKIGGRSPVVELRGHTGPVWSAVFSPDGKSVLTSSEDRTARVWDAATGANVDTLTGSAEPLRSAEFNSTGQYLITLGNQIPVRVMETSAPGVIQLHHNGQANAAVFSPDGKLLATSSFDLAVTVWDASTHRPVQVLSGLQALPINLAINKDSTLVAVGCSDARVHLFDLKKGTAQAPFEEFPASVRSVAFSTDGKLLMASSMDGTSRVWDVSSRRMIAQLQARQARPDLLYEMAFDPSGQLLARAGQGGVVEILEVPDGAVKATLKGHSKEIQRLHFSRDGRYLITAGRDETARVWEVATGKSVAVLRGHHGWVTDADMDVSGKTVVTAGQDKSVWVWDVATGQAIAHFRDATAAVYSVSFSPDGRFILSAAADGLARLYPPEMFAPFEQLRQLAATRERRKLSAAEIQAYLAQ